MAVSIGSFEEAMCYYLKTNEKSRVNHSGSLKMRWSRPTVYQSTLIDTVRMTMSRLCGNREDMVCNLSLLHRPQANNLFRGRVGEYSKVRLFKSPRSGHASRTHAWQFQVLESEACRAFEMRPPAITDAAGSQGAVWQTERRRRSRKNPSKIGTQQPTGVRL